MSKIVILAGQDRDVVIYPFDMKKLQVKDYYVEEVFWGVNIYYGKDILLGTYDDQEEVAAELSAIRDCKRTFYQMSGYEDFNVFDRRTKIKELLT